MHTKFSSVLFLKSSPKPIKALQISSFDLVEFIISCSKFAVDTGTVAVCWEFVDDEAVPVFES